MSRDVSVRDLRNHTSVVLRRVEAGERVRVTVDRRPVAELIPLQLRPTWVSGEAWRGAIEGHEADRELLDALREAQPQTTDELSY